VPPRITSRLRLSAYGPPVLVFAVSLAWLAWLALHRLVFTLDEGIYLEGAARLLHGQVPYRDFFVLTGPASFWLCSLWFRIAGVGLAAARATVVFDLALLTAAVYRISRRRAGVPASGLASFCFLSFAAADPAAVTVNHRWDGIACAVVAVIFALRFLDRRRARDAAFAGAAAALAAWFTPSLALAGVVLGAFFSLRRELRPAVTWFFGGFAAVCAAWVGWLANQGAWPAFLRHMAWSASNYSGANRVWYGAVNGGYAALFADCPAPELPVRALVVACLALPALLPLWTTSGLLWRIRRDDVSAVETVLLLSCQAALVAASYPRWDLSHLLQVSSISYALTAWLLAGFRHRAPARIPGWAGACFAAFFLTATVLSRLDLVPVRTRAGNLLAARADLALVRAVEAGTTAGEPIFVYPYMPLIYLLSGGRNPTAYSFLQPGMMTEADEKAALAALERDRPARIVYSDIPAKSYLWLFPSSDPSRLRMAALEDFIERRYECVASVRNAGTTYRILKPRQGAG
jgi:hypothetical protein